MPRYLPRLAVAAAVVLAFWPVLGFTFLNWDDQAVIADNPSLALPGALGWAFTTTYMQHYQPVSWLAWSGIGAAGGAHAAAFHAANLAGHLVATLLVFAVARRLLSQQPDGSAPAWRDGIAAVAALLFGLHPLRAEVVAWVSAFPYTLALALALASLLAWLGESEARRARSVVPALALFTLSLLARPVALGFPVVLVLLDLWRHGRTMAASLRRAAPFAGVALAAGVAEATARASGLADVSWLYRLQLAASAPFVYLWRTLAPVRLTPLDVLPLVPEARVAVVAGAILGLIAVSALAWVWRRRWPGFGVAWAAYLALLAPAAGLVPSGLQATADRYTYIPAVVVALALAGAAAAWAARRRWRQGATAVVAVALVFALAVASRASLAPWSDSVSLWTHAVAIDPANDVALYNLGTALAAAGRSDEAAARYREALAVNPAHAEARANLARIDAPKLEQEGNDLAARGDLLAAVQRYEQALALDPGRTHAHAALGMALATLGRLAEARPHLEEARRQGDTDAAVANALGVLLAQAGETRAARDVFEGALAVHRNDVGLALNLAQLLMTAPPEDGGNPELALRLARAVADATGNRDPRIVETLAAALAANGQMTEARATNARAADLARQQGDADLAGQITARGRAYRNPGP